MDRFPGLIGLLPLWILIAGAAWIGSTAWFDPAMRRRRGDPRPRPGGPPEADRPVGERWRGPT